MAAAPEPLLMTVEEFSRLPERDDVIQELHWGIVVTLTRPKMRHAKVQLQLVDLLRPLAIGKGQVGAEIAFRALPEYEVRGADVAFVSSERWEGSGDDDYLHGSPELVIEVLSPSNTKREIQEKAALCLSTGAREFWIIDSVRKLVTVMHPGAESRVFVEGEMVPVSILQGNIAVSDIFSTLQ